MKNLFRVLAAAAAIAIAASCGSMEQMAKQAESLVITCDPAVLEVIGGSIDATVSVTYPEGYFLPKAILEVTPVLVYDGGEAKMEEPFMYQGEKVKDNYKVVSSKGQTVTEKVHFDYVEGMENSYLELRGVVKAKKKDIALPVVKVAQGANTTYMLLKADGYLAEMKDNYQETTTTAAEGQILYLVNSSEVRQSELKSASVKDFLAELDEINSNDRATITGTSIVAYASPEGAIDLNNQLSERRSQSAGKAWNQLTKGSGIIEPTVISVGEDWEGFQKLVSESSIEDKELIIRVLSMYSDPAVRENEIRNMSEVFTALKQEVLPELRRARLIADVQYKNFTPEELLAMYKDDPSSLDEEALLRLASVSENEADKEDVLKKAVKLYGSDRAQYNLAVLYMKQGKNDKAEQALAEVKDGGDDVINAMGVLALRKGDLETAEDCFSKSKSEEAKANMGLVYVLTGRYDEAAAALADAPGCPVNKALAYILAGDIDKAADVLKCGSDKANYLRAIIAARKGDADGVAENLHKIKDAGLKARAEKDVEFAGYVW
ncbi:MAG: tetratricopeptide repeat protein [Bacteroidales bacterium]|nr:tetratricopeptide repeat protein [Bacteroidales bacterium]